MSRHYLDHASTSPPRPAVVAAMRSWFERADGSVAGDPARIHHEGLATRVAVEEAREVVGACFGARSREVVFTSGATESIATATWGAAERGGQILVPAVEHSAVRAASAAFADGAHAVITIAVDGRGRVDVDAVRDHLAVHHAEVALVHVQLANHEVGTVQPVAEVVATCREHDVLVHVDAAAAAGHVAIDFRELGADLLSISAHKFGGPPGIGALLVRRGVRLRPLLVGGDQERARRAGYENVPAILGFAAACQALGDGGLEREAVHARALTERVVALADGLDGVTTYGDRDHRLPHLVCLGIAGIEPQPVLLGLDRAGIAAHSGSACSSEALEPSPVLEAMGVDAHRSLRVSTGWSTTDDDIDALVAALPGVLDGLRSLRSSGEAGGDGSAGAAAAGAPHRDARPG